MPEIRLTFRFHLVGNTVTWRVPLPFVREQFQHLATRNLHDEHDLVIHLHHLLVQFVTVAHIILLNEVAQTIAVIVEER